MNYHDFVLSYRKLCPKTDVTKYNIYTEFIYLISKDCNYFLPHHNSTLIDPKFCVDNFNW